MTTSPDAPRFAGCLKRDYTRPELAKFIDHNVVGILNIIGIHNHQDHALLDPAFLFLIYFSSLFGPLSYLQRYCNNTIVYSHIATLTSFLGFLVCFNVLSRVRRSDMCSLVHWVLSTVDHDVATYHHSQAA
ncbi:hypothetical protein AcV5_000337 [Taiwanofungus camphoratus]|nr:hypothetical protein AcV7_003527 [Antrodia cinnamomea]KAI0938720.1 hypothetical protein AcV5_000337 [Antrodia cinnamomea]